MSIQRRIVQRLFESRGLSESSFESGGSTYKCAFGRYYKDDEEIDRDEYFKAKGEDSTTSNNEASNKIDIESTLEKYESEVEDALGELKTTDYDDRDEILNRLSTIKKALNEIDEEDFSDEQFERYEEITDKIFSADDIPYEPEEYEPDWDSMPGGHDDY